MDDLLQELRAVANRHVRVESYVRADAKADSEAVVVSKKRNQNTYLPDYTRKFLRAIGYAIPDDGRVIFLNIPVFANPGDGKAVAVDMPVLTPTGWRAIGELRVGDAVIGSDGQPHTVTGVFPQGRKQVYTVTMSDGGSVETCDEHLWFTTTKNDVRQAGLPGQIRSQQQVRETLYWKESGSKGPSNGKRLVHAIPLVKPIEFAPQTQALPMDPYLLGALLGDGYLGTKYLAFHNVEPDVLDRVAGLLKPDETAPIHVTTAPGVRGLRVRRGAGQQIVHAKQQLVDLGLWGTDCFTKHIPQQYLLASQEARWNLLRGLIDTDGSMNTRGNSVEFATSSDRLRDDVLFLVRSLGGLASSTTRRTHYTYLGEKKQGQPSHRLLIRFPPGAPMAFGSTKNQKKWKGEGNQIARRIASIEPAGEKDCVCIEVDSEDQLFVTKDFILTHNTFTAITIILHLMKLYGREKVAVAMSDHIPSLVDFMRTNRKPVQILIIDDALKNYSSRGGGNNELLEAIELFTTLRHEYESAQNTYDGIVFTMFTSQMYKGLDKVFREGFPVFKSALVSDKEEIMSATQMGSTAWDYLLEILRDVKVNHQKTRMNDSVVILPGLPAGKITLPPLENDPIVDSLLLDIHEANPANEDAFAMAMEPNVSIARKYKCIEKAWTILRSRLTPEEELARLARIMDEYAARFASKHEDDPGTNEGKAAIRDWLEKRVYDLHMDPEERIPSDDYLKIKVPANFKVFCEKVATQRSRMARARVISEGFAVAGDTLGDNEIMDYAAKFILEKFQFDPDNKDDWGRYLSLLYKLPVDVRQDAIRLKTPIKDRMRDMWRGKHPIPNSGKGAATPIGPRPAPATANVAEDLAKKFDLRGDYFMVNRAELLDELIRKAAIKHGTDDLTFRHLMVYKACEFGLKYADKTLDNPTELATTNEGKAWQQEVFNEVVSRVPLEKSKHAGKKIFHNQIGGLYEIYVEQKLRDGYTVPGVFDRIIAKVERGGGNDHTPDIIITYNDGAKDYVSLKCYNNTETFSITTKRSGEDEIAPERAMLAKDEAAGVTGNRVVVLVRNLAYDGLQSCRIFDAVEDIPETLKFNKQDQGQYPWVPRVDAGRASSPAVETSPAVL